MAQTPEQKKAWTQANAPDMHGLTPPQYRMLLALWRLRLSDGVQAWHGERRVAAYWRAAGGHPQAPLLGSLLALERAGYAERSKQFWNTWRLRRLPDHVASALDADRCLQVLATPRRIRAVA